MKLKNILLGIGFLIIFFILVHLLEKTSPRPAYDYDKYTETIALPIEGTIRRVLIGKTNYGAEIGVPGKYFELQRDADRTPREWLNNYPKDFILEGDSVSKKANNDSFDVFRNSHCWTYVLPVKKN